MVNCVYILLGSNIDKERNLPEAVRRLATLTRVTAVSSVYETAPVGLEDQPHFFNAAVLAETELPAATFRTQVLARVEQLLGRVRTADKNAPRTIDADMILFNDAVFDLDETWEVTPASLRGKSRNCTFLGERLTGRVRLTVVDGARRFARARGEV